MFIEVWSAKTAGDKWNEANELWKKGVEIIKKHPAVVDGVVLRPMGGEINRLFSMFTFESIEKQQEYYNSIPDEVWEHDKAAKKSGTYDVDSVKISHYYEP